jgi:hypothetical protein
MPQNENPFGGNPSYKDTAGSLLDFHREVFRFMSMKKQGDQDEVEE